MSRSTLDSFDSTVYKTHEWLQEVMVELGLGDRYAAYIGLRSALHGLRDRLPIQEAVQLGAQLPMLVRGFYYEGWNPVGKPVKTHKEEFLDAIRDGFKANLNRPDPETVARAVFKVLSRRISAGEVDDIKSNLPKDLRSLWPESSDK